jgi:hypothetical protein
MHPKHANNCRELQARFEGKEAIYAGYGVLRVRVHDIRARAGFSVSAEIEEIPTQGLGVGVLRLYQHGLEPMRHE